MESKIHEKLAEAYKALEIAENALSLAGLNRKAERANYARKEVGEIWLSTPFPKTKGS
jgi:hypothetical protein